MTCQQDYLQLVQIGNEKVFNNQRPIINHYFSHVHASFRLGIEQRPNRSQNNLQDQTGTGLA